MPCSERRRKFAIAAAALAVCAPAMAGQDGVKLLGRWLISDSGATATYAGSQILLGFENSSRVAADFTVSATQRNSQDLYIAVTVDGGKPVRFGLSPGSHPGLVLATNLSLGPHVVAVRKEGEPYFGALGFARPTLDPAARWRAIVDDRPIVEVIGDSDATGICALGPDSPAVAVNLFTAAWAFQSVSWVGLLEQGLAGVGHPVDMVDLAVSGSDTKQEAAAYDYTAFSYSHARFSGYSPPGRPHASLVLMWGGANDLHGGGDTVVDGPVTYANLTPFQLGVYAQLTKIFDRNPGVKIVLLQYIDVTLPDWTAGYRQVTSLFSDEQRRRILFLSVHDPKGLSDACKVDPLGHPNLSMHATWAAQILVWMMSPEVLPQLGFPAGEQWNDR